MSRSASTSQEMLAVTESKPEELGRKRKRRTTLVSMPHIEPGQPRRKAPVSSIASRMKNDPCLRGAARIDDKGNVMASAGSIDPEAVGAAVAMCASQLSQIEALLCMGRVQGWCSVTKESSLFVQQTKTSSVVAVGETPKDPYAVLKKLVSEE